MDDEEEENEKLVIEFMVNKLYVTRNDHMGFCKWFGMVAYHQEIWQHAEMIESNELVMKFPHFLN